MKKNAFIFFIFILTLSLSSFTSEIYSDRESRYILKETRKAISATFDLEFFSLEKKNIKLSESRFLSAHSFYNIIDDEKTKGYAVIATAPSKTDNFQYLLLLDIKFTIKKVKVLIYREDYGGEISSKRWLSQFSKNEKKFPFIYRDNISAISGATISVKSITTSINDVMNSLRTLESQKEI